MKDPGIYSEAELIQLLRQQDANAFVYLYDNYAPALNGIILTIIDDRELAADVLQEVFIKIWRHIDQYDSRKGRLFTWMHKALSTHSRLGAGHRATLFSTIANCTIN